MLPSEKNGPAAIRQPPSSVVMNGPPFCPQALNLGCALGPFWVRAFLTWNLASEPFDSPALPKRGTCMYLVLRRTMDHAAPSPQRFANTHCSCQCACSRMEQGIHMRNLKDGTPWRQSAFLWGRTPKKMFPHVPTRNYALSPLVQEQEQQRPRLPRPSFQRLRLVLNLAYAAMTSLSTNKKDDRCRSMVIFPKGPRTQIIGF